MSSYTARTSPGLEHSGKDSSKKWNHNWVVLNSSSSSFIPVGSSWVEDEEQVGVIFDTPYSDEHTYPIESVVLMNLVGTICSSWTVKPPSQSKAIHHPPERTKPPSAPVDGVRYWVEWMMPSKVISLNFMGFTATRPPDLSVYSTTTHPVRNQSDKTAQGYIRNPRERWRTHISFTCATYFYSGGLHRDTTTRTDTNWCPIPLFRPPSEQIVHVLPLSSSGCSLWIYRIVDGRGIDTN